MSKTAINRFGFLKPHPAGGAQGSPRARAAGQHGQGLGRGGGAGARGPQNRAAPPPPASSAAVQAATCNLPPALATPPVGGDSRSANLIRCWWAEPERTRPLRGGAEEVLLWHWRGGGGAWARGGVVSARGGARRRPVPVKRRLRGGGGGRGRWRRERRYRGSG